MSRARAARIPWVTLIMLTLAAVVAGAQIGFALVQELAP